MKTQFQSLIQHELKRLEHIVAHNELATYPVLFRSYPRVAQKKHPSSYYRFVSFIRMVHFFL